MKYFPLLLFFLSSLNLSGEDSYPSNRNYDVTHYRFNIYLSDSCDMIRGEAFLRIFYTGSSSGINLDFTGINKEGKGMVIESVTLNEEPVEWIHSDNLLKIIFPVVKNAGETSRIVVSYYGIPADGLIISKNRHGDRTFFADNWPDRARNWIPCIDHPSDKSTVEFLVYAPDYYKVVSNGYLFEESNLTEGIKLTHWKEDVSISTKVMVIGVAKFAARLEATIGGTDIWSFVYPQEREKGFEDYSIAVKPFTYFSDEIGTYAYEKLANVQSKTIFGGMENAGCIFYSERSVTGKNKVEGLMAHEIAHQWFGNSVTEQDWHHIWLSEGFATYFTTCYLEHEYGELRLRSSMQQARARVLRAYENRPAPVIDTTIINYMNLLNANSYQKGAWVLHMLRNELGDRMFIHAIRTYYSRFRNKTALTSDFINSVEEISGKDLSDFFYQWLYVSEIPELIISYTYNTRKKEVNVLVEQVQPNHIFSFPLDLEIVTMGESSIETVSVTGREQRYSFRVDSRPDKINTDPMIKLLYKN